MMKLVNALHSVFSRGLPFLSRCCCCSLSELLKVFTWDFSRCYFFTLAFISLFSAKSLHLYAHLHSLPAPKFLVWGITFFFQDVIILLFFRIFAQKISWRLVSAIFALIVVPFSLLMSGMASANISFYAVTGAEIHWAQAKSFNGDAAAIRTLLTGLTGFLIVEAILLVATWFAAIPVHRMTGGILHVWAWPFRWLLARFWPWLGPFIQRLQSRIRNQPLPDPQVYEQINIDEYDDDKSENGRESVDLLDAERAESSPSSSSPSSPENRRTDTALRRTLILGPFCLFLLLRYLRPYDPVYMFLSSTLPAAPFLVGGDRQSPVDLTGLPGNYTFLEGRTALLPPPQWDWLPKQPLPGFEDWAVSDGRHYDARADPLHISNLQNPLLHSIERAMLHNVKIKHVVLLKLESTRGDVFPLRKDSFMWNRIAETYRDKQIPNEVRDRIANLTRTAEYLTNFPTGFEHNDNVFAGRKAYGGISARNAVTSGTYTLKSLVGTLCGVSPLVADFNSEYKHHIYQPCLSHVFNAINHQSDITNQTDDFTAWPWHAAWMQSVTDSYDNQDQLTPALGYHDVLTKEVIESPNATHYPVKSEEVNYYGYPDTELREYIRDAIDNAERNHTRLFLTHLTGTTHHPWGVPNNAFEQIMGPSSWSAHDEDLNRYLNTIGFVDKWLAEIIGILEEKGVINETLFVMAGDHGLSLPNDGGVTPYDNPHIGSFHVPIVLAHPQLPPVEIDTPVSNDQIVPTILDLLIESSSLSEAGTRAMRDILSLYERQSMIRPLLQQQDGKQDWQFTVMNTGGSWLSVRSAARPTFRLVVPLVTDLEWRFTDLERDPNEVNPIEHFSLIDMASTLEQAYGPDVVDWLRDAAHVTDWWVLENWKRYGYSGPSNSG